MKAIRVVIKAELLVPDDAEIAPDLDPNGDALVHVKMGDSWFLPWPTWARRIKPGEWETDPDGFEEEVGGDLKLLDHSIQVIKTGVEYEKPKASSRQVRGRPRATQASSRTPDSP